MPATPVVVSLGVHVLDVLARPVTHIPDGQGGELIEEIRATPAGTAAGTALIIAKLGAESRSAGAIGTDALGDLLLTLLHADGVDTSMVVRRADVQTSASVLPIRPDGSRPALHVIGANATFTPADVAADAFAGVDHLHLGGPEFLGGENAAQVLQQARAAGATTSADLLAPGDPGILEWVGGMLEHLDYLLPNDEQLLGFTGESDLTAAARALVARGVGCVAVTRGAQGALVVTQDDVVEVPAYAVDVIDTTGCGDAFSAGFVVGRALGRDLRAAAQLGCATASFVAGGLGTDHGDYSLEAADRLIAEDRTLPIAG
jgi:sugar/nucleoside kinase (ribokinase family)